MCSTVPTGDDASGLGWGSASQLLTYHFMFGPDWDEGCPSCSLGSLGGWTPGHPSHPSRRHARVRRACAVREARCVSRADGMDDALLLVSTQRLQPRLPRVVHGERDREAHGVQLHEVRASVRGAARHRHVRENRRRPRVPHVLELRTRPRSPRRQAYQLLDLAPKSWTTRILE